MRLRKEKKHHSPNWWWMLPITLWSGYILYLEFLFWVLTHGWGIGWFAGVNLTIGAILGWILPVVSIDIAKDEVKKAMHYANQ